MSIEEDNQIAPLLVRRECIALLAERRSFSINLINVNDLNNRSVVKSTQWLTLSGSYLLVRIGENCHSALGNQRF